MNTETLWMLLGFLTALVLSLGLNLMILASRYQELEAQVKFLRDRLESYMIGSKS